MLQRKNSANHSGFEY